MKYLLLAVLLALTSCTGVVTSRTFTQLKNGMAQQVSMQKLGKADLVIEKDGMELHKYTDVYGPKTYHPGCNKCVTMRKCDYFAVYRNGKLIEFGQMHHRFQPHPIVTEAFFDS